MNGLELRNHFSLESSNEVAQICNSVLLDIGITYFNYIKIHHDGSRELLTNNAPWIDHFYKNSLYKSVAAIDIEHLLPKGYFLWSELKADDPAYTHGREIFNIDNGISFVVKKKAETLLYIFAATRNNYTINNFYVRNIDLLKRFILYFTDSALSLIKKASKNKIYLPEKQFIHPRKVMMPNMGVEKRSDFLRKTQIKRFYFINQENDLYLTKREAECVAHMLNGATAKQTAQLLNISFRTVESHLQKIKEKLHCFSKEDVVNLLIDTNIHDVILTDIIK